MLHSRRLGPVSFHTISNPEVTGSLLIQSPVQSTDYNLLEEVKSHLEHRLKGIQRLLHVSNQ
uniref:Uncharacterized protein n=1 Tax=Physcomitrium patens TaxID=3218 RepID=A0A2K1K434_PHYPA|nr:hypothetical protein PHYPA_013006 [Physcomitrium patens]